MNFWSGDLKTNYSTAFSYIYAKEKKEGGFVLMPTHLQKQMSAHVCILGIHPVNIYLSGVWMQGVWHTVLPSGILVNVLRDGEN